MKRDKLQAAWIVVFSLLACFILVCLSISGCASKNINSPQVNVPSQNATPSAGTPATTPVVTPPTATPKPPPPLPPPPAPPAPPAPPPPPPSAIPPTPVVPLAPVITRQASQMVLTLDDMGPGWLRGIAGSAGQAQVYSSSHVQYTKGTSFSPVVQNTVAVYRSVAAAQNAYEAERPTTASVSNPGIGDESFLNDSVPIDKKLVFRKDNVVVWVWLQNDKTEDPVHYAQIIEPRITP